MLRSFWRDRGFLGGMGDGEFAKAKSEEQKSLPFNFVAPRLDLTQDKSQARIFGSHQAIIGFIIDGSYRCTTKTANATGRSWKGHLLVDGYDTSPIIFRNPIPYTFHSTK